MALDRITELFIMEAEEHLDTLEQGLVDLPTTMQDPENIREMFRGAHSIKGSAAQLGLTSIQKTAHRLEDCFKILRDDPVGKVDKKSEDLFLKGVDSIRDLINRLKSPFSLSEEDGLKVVQAIMPVYAELENHLNTLVQKKSSPIAASPVAKTVNVPSATVATQVMAILKQMLQIFKQPDSPASRKQLVGWCDRLLQLAPEIKTWQAMVKVVQVAIINPKNSYQTLAPIAIKELKDAGDLLQAGKAAAIAPSKNLQLLGASASPKTPTPATPKQIVIPADPKAAAKVLLQSFDKKQLSQLVKILIQAIKLP